MTQDDHDWLKHVALLIWLININTNIVVLTVYKCFCIVYYLLQQALRKLYGMKFLWFSMA